MEDIKANLHQKMLHSIKMSVVNQKMGISFSGGVDSSLLAKLSSDAGYDVTLLTIGFSGSHDIEFSQKIGKLLGYSHQIEEIDPNSFNHISEEIRKVIDTDNLSWLENCIAFYYVSKLAQKIAPYCSHRW